MELTPEIRQRLKFIMESKNDTGYTLNKKLGISATTIGNYLSGKITKADNTKIKAMCDLWGITMEWLESGDDMVKLPGNETITDDFATETPENMIKQIFLKLNSKDEQFTNIRKDTRSIRDDMMAIKKEIAHLNQELSVLKSELLNLKGN